MIGTTPRNERCIIRGRKSSSCAEKLQWRRRDRTHHTRRRGWERQAVWCGRRMPPCRPTSGEAHPQFRANPRLSASPPPAPAPSPTPGWARGVVGLVRFPERQGRRTGSLLHGTPNPQHRPPCVASAKLCRMRKVRERKRERGCV